MAEQFIYKIQTPDGLYSTGGERPRFTNKGKVWRARGHVTSHLRIAGDRYPPGTLVVRFRVVEEADQTVGVGDWEESPSTTRARELQEERQLKRHRDMLERQRQDLERQLKMVDEKLQSA